MTWFKVDDSFHSHPKVLSVELAAVGLWTIAGAWSSANLTEGFVPDFVLPRLGTDARKLADALVTAGLWKRAKGGFKFHDWDTFQPSKEKVLKTRQNWAEKKANQREAKRTKNQKPSSKQGVSPGDIKGDSPEESQAGPSLPVPVPVPVVSSEEETTTTGEQQEVDLGAQIPVWAQPLVAALTREGLTVRWNLSTWEWVTIQKMLGTLGEPAMILHARRSWKPDDPPGHARYFFKVWRDLPPIPPDAPLKPAALPAAPTQNTSQRDRAMERARAREAAANNETH